MKLKASTGRKLRYGGISAALTALIIAAVVLLNVIFSALTQKFLWYVDLTPELLYTLSDKAYAAMEKEDEEFGSKSPIQMIDAIREEKKAADPSFDPSSLKINIIFCDYADNLDSNFTQKLIHFTAQELKDKYPDYFNIEYYDIIRNPSSVSKFKANSLDQIYTTSVIIEFGTEYRVREIRSFFKFNSSTDEEPWAYNGEKAFISSILAVTRAESPVAGIVTNHGEQINAELLQTLVDAGYEIMNVNLAEINEFPANCRLLVVYNPVSDFLVADGVSEIDEIEKLDRFMHDPESPADSDRSNSLMVFMNPETKRLNNLEDYLEEWGIKFNRTEVDQFPHLVCDTSQSLSADGYTFKADYVTTGAAASLTEDMRSRPTPQSIIFKNAMSISYSEKFTPVHYTPEEGATENTEEYDYATNYENGVSRAIYDVFVTSKNAKAYAGNFNSPVESASDTQKIKLMTVSMESHTTQEDNYSTSTETSYVFACGSTEFANTELLQSSSYGNTDFLLTALRAIGREPVPIGLSFKSFADDEIDTVTTAEAIQYTLVLTLVPLIAVSITGIVIIVRRKNR